VNHTAYPATIPIDYSVCGGKCIFKFYWLALDEPEWHAYSKRCCIRDDEIVEAPS
jgi:hypothetical protein